MKEHRSYWLLVCLLAGNTGIVWTSEWTPWSSCSVTCDVGYQTRTLQCLPGDGLNCTNGTEDRRSCTGPVCVSNQTVCSSETCQNGGTCQAVESRSYCRCTSNYTGPSCEFLFTGVETTCPPLTEPLRGWVLVSGESEIARYGCDFNHFLVGGNSTRRCNRETGQWSGRAPKCHKETTSSSSCHSEYCHVFCVFGYLRVRDPSTGCDVCNCYKGCPDEQYGDIRRCHQCNCLLSEHCDRLDGFCSDHPPPDQDHLVTGEMPYYSGDYSTEDPTIPSLYQSTGTLNTWSDTPTPSADDKVGSDNLQAVVIGAASAGGISFSVIAFLLVFCLWQRYRQGHDQTNNVKHAGSKKSKSLPPEEPILLGSAVRQNDAAKPSCPPTPPPRPPDHDHRYMTLLPEGDNSFRTPDSNKYHQPVNALLQHSTDGDSESTVIYEGIDDVIEEKSRIGSQSDIASGSQSDIASGLEMGQIQQLYIDLDRPATDDYIEPIESCL